MPRKNSCTFTVIFHIKIIFIIVEVHILQDFAVKNIYIYIYIYFFKLLKEKCIQVVFYAPTFEWKEILHEDHNRTAISGQHMNENQNTDFKGDKVETAFLKMHY